MLLYLRRRDVFGRNGLRSNRGKDVVIRASELLGQDLLPIVGT